MSSAGSPERPRAWWPIPVRCLTLCLLVFGFCFLLRLKETHDLLLAPSWERRVNTLGFALPLIPAVGFIFLALRRTVSAKHVLPLAGVLLLSVIGAGAVQLLGPSFPLGPTLKASTSSPDGREAGIWYSSFLDCSWELYVSEPHQLLSHRVARFSADCTDVGAPSVRWLEDGGAALDVDGGVPAKPLNLFPAWN